MIENLTLSEGRQLDQAFEQSPYDYLGELEASMPLQQYDDGRRYGSNDPSAAMKPKGGGKEINLPDLSPAIRKMLAKNKNRSQMGPNFRDDSTERATRFYYADHGDAI